MKRHAIVAVATLAILAGCSASGPRSPAEAGAASHALFAGQEHVVVWVPGSPGVGGSIASAMVGSVGLDSPTVAQIHRVISPAASNPVRIAVSGRDSAFAAKATLAALNEVQGKLPKLSLAFVGDQADAVAVQKAVEAKDGNFLFSPTH